tara:strand:- start:472 stop:990 length:519 start_codon:yes stop_codon:yes gene_type:complete
LNADGMKKQNRILTLNSEIMYFESRLNSIKDVTNLSIEEQVKAIKQLGIGNAIKIGSVLWINDENPSGTGIKEAALLYQFSNKTVQFESVTVDWCSDLQIMKLIIEYGNTELLKSDYGIDNLSPIRFNDQEAMSWFDCGCCGTGFKSTISYQSKFDQDAGYGICTDCDSYYK